jgi:putative tricarboxylic transport membrane protein
MTGAAPRGGFGERVFAAVIGIVFAGQFILALRYPPDPRLFPLIIAGIGCVLTVLLVIGLGLHDAEHGAPARLARGKLILTLAVSPAYGLSLWLLGYWISTLIAIPLVAWQLGYRNRTVLALVTVGIALALGLTFPLVNVPLPRGFLFAHFTR